MKAPSVEPTLRMPRTSRHYLFDRHPAQRGWMPEYVDAMWRMLQLDKPQAFVIATGVSISLQEFMAAAFAEVGLDWQAHVVQDAQLFRPTEIRHSRGDASKAHEHLGWQASMTIHDVARLMVRHELDPMLPL